VTKNKKYACKICGRVLTKFLKALRNSLPILEFMKNKTRNGRVNRCLKSTSNELTIMY
jgi:hypothetical protein